MKHSYLVPLTALVCSTSWAQDFSLPTTVNVGGDACYWHGATPITMNQQGLYVFKAQVNFLKTNALLKQGTCEFTVKITPSPGKMIVISGATLQFQLSLQPYTSAKIGYSLYDMASAQNYDLADAVASGGLNQSFVRNLNAPNAMMRGRCGSAMELRSVIRVSLSNRGLSPGSAISSSDPQFKISAVPCQ